MATQSNTFVRKFGKMAIVITVTDWNDFKELEKYSENEDPDFLISSMTQNSIYSNGQPSMQHNLFTAEDITEQTKGQGLSAILTGDLVGGSKYDGGFWSYKKCGLTYSEEVSQPKITE